MSCSACVNSFHAMSETCPLMLPSSRSRIASRSTSEEAPPEGSDDVKVEHGEDVVEEDEEGDLEGKVARSGEDGVGRGVGMLLHQAPPATPH